MARPSNPNLISQAAFARLMGVARQSVNKAVKGGRISTTDGKIDPAIAKKQWARNTDPSTAKNAVTGFLFPGLEGTPPAKKKTPLASSPPADENGKGNGHPSIYMNARARRETATAEKVELELQKLRGELVAAAEVRTAAFTLARRSRDLLNALPERTAVTLAAMTDPEDVLRHLEAEIGIICRELSNGNGKPDDAEGES